MNNLLAQFLANVVAYLHLMGLTNDDITGIFSILIGGTITIIALQITGHGGGRSSNGR